MNLITSLPFTITSPGVWRLGVSFDAYALGTTPAIVLGCDDIELDGGDEWLINSANPTNQGVGVYGLNRSRCIIRGMRIFGHGFAHAIHLENKDNFASEGRNIVVDCPKIGSNFRAMLIAGRESRIQNNVINNVAGASWATDLYIMGIECFGFDSIITDNVISEVYGDSTGESVGISLTAYSDHSIVRNNVIKNVNRIARTMAFWVGSPNDTVRLVDNVIDGWERALFGTSQTGIADGNRTYDCGPLPGQPTHPVWDIPGSNLWTGNNMGT